MNTWTLSRSLSSSLLHTHKHTQTQIAVVLWLAQCPVFIIRHYGFNPACFTFGTTAQLFTYCSGRLKPRVSSSAKQGNGRSQEQPRSLWSFLSLRVKWLRSHTFLSPCQVFVYVSALNKRSCVASAEMFVQFSLTGFLQIHETEGSTCTSCRFHPFLIKTFVMKVVTFSD